MRVGFIGLGIMGSRMAANLLRKGHDLTVWNRTSDRADELRAAGAKWAQSPAELAASVEAVCICVADPPAMQAVSDGPTGFLSRLAPGTLVIDFSTMGPEVTRGLETACRDRGAQFLESPVTGSKNLAASGTLLLMCGGPTETFDRAQPILQAVGARSVYIGEVGQAAQVKLIGNLIVAHMVEALSEGAALAAHAGVPMDKLLEVVQGSAYASPYWEFKGKALATRDFSTHFSIDLMHKDLTLALRLADTLTVPLPGTAAIREVYQLARAQGFGHLDVIATAAVIDPALNVG